MGIERWDRFVVPNVKAKQGALAVVSTVMAFFCQALGRVYGFVCFQIINQHSNAMIPAHALSIATICLISSLSKAINYEPNLLTGFLLDGGASRA